MFFGANSIRTNKKLLNSPSTLLYWIVSRWQHSILVLIFRSGLLMSLSWRHTSFGIFAFNRLRRRELNVSRSVVQTNKQPTDVAAYPPALTITKPVNSPLKFCLAVRKLPVCSCNSHTPKNLRFCYSLTGILDVTVSLCIETTNWKFLKRELGFDWQSKTLQCRRKHRYPLTTW